MKLLANWLNSVGGNPYELGKKIAAATGEDPKTVGIRWFRWVRGRGLKTLQLIEADLSAAGYELKITRKKHGKR